MSHPSEKMCAEYFAELLKPLLDAKVNCWVAGGAIRAWYQDRNVTTDIDVWFPNESEWKRAN